MTESQTKVQPLSSEIMGLRYHSTKSKGPLKAVIFHGYGANCHDLYPLAPYLDNELISEWIFPNGLISALGAPGGRAWFPIDIIKLEEAMQRGEYRDFSEPISKEVIFAREKIKGLLFELNLQPETTIVGGFSQGAMLATDLFLNTEETFKSLLIMSGTWLGKNEWSDLAKEKCGRFFQCHGKSDPLLPFSLAQELSEMLMKNGWQGLFHPFNGGHEIPHGALEQLKGFLKSMNEES